MKIKPRQIFYFISITIMIILFILSSTDLILKEKVNPIYTVSVILNDTTDIDYSNFMIGAHQSYRKYTVDINYVVLEEKGSLKEQQKLIDSEIKNGADGIIVFPSEPINVIPESESISIFDKSNISVPIIYVSSTLSTNDNFIYNNSTSRGEALGDYITEEIEKEFLKPFNAYAFSDMFSQSEVYNINDGLRSVLKEKQDIELLSKSYIEAQSLYSELDKLFADYHKPVIVALDSQTLRHIAKYCENNDIINPMLFGAGDTEDIINYIRDDVIRAVSINNEYNIGYLSTQKLLNIIENNPIDSVDKDIKINHYIINKERLFDSEYEKFLFPIN